MSTTPLLPPPGESAASPPAGWYADPASPASWRWWNGHAWTTYVGAPGPQRRKPRLPRFLSGPVAVSAPVVLVGVALIAVSSPVSVVAGLVPLAIVLPALSWLDRIEPEPTSSRVHALLWGACVAVLVSIVVNTIVGVLAGEIASMVISAPIIEEASKAAGIVWALRRRELDGVTDGIVYAGWIALGFAVVEDMTYFALATVEGSFAPVFVVRAILTPFAHPLFTFWSGLAIGRAVQRGRPVFPAALWGFAIAVGTHALWNGSLAVGEIRPDLADDVAAGVIAATALIFVALFVAVAITLVVARRREQRRFVKMTPFLMQRYGLSHAEAAGFESWAALIAARKGHPRRARGRFDDVHAALARLSMLHERLNAIDPDTQRILHAQLDEAREALDRATSG